MGLLECLRLYYLDGLDLFQMCVINPVTEQKLVFTCVEYESTEHFDLFLCYTLLPYHFLGLSLVIGSL